NSSTAPYVYLDDIYYEDIMSCAFPLNIKVTNVNSNSATISWDPSITSGVSSYEYELRADGLAPLSGVVTGTTYNVTGLVPGVSYQVYVRAVCRTNKGGWTTYPVVLTTNCGEVDGNFFQGFEGISGGSTSSPAPIHCWTYLNTTGGSSAYGYVY